MIECTHKHRTPLEQIFGPLGEGFGPLGEHVAVKRVQFYCFDCQEMQFGFQDRWIIAGLIKHKYLKCELN